MFEQYETLAKEQYPDFDFSGWGCGSVMKKIQTYEENFDFCEFEDYAYKGDNDYFYYKIPNGYVGCVFTKSNADDYMFFMINIRGIK